MEEARSPPSIKFGDYDETSSNMGDVSHLFSDDGTLVSVHQRGGSMSGDTKWKAPLEAAVRECQRVREQLQSVQRTFGDERQRLQGEMTRLQTTIERLEVENVKLSVEAIRKAEETGLLEAALAEAQQNIAELQSLFESTVSERDDAIGDTEDKTKQLQQLEQDKAEIEQTLGQAIEENASLESQVQTSEKERDELSSELQAVSASLEEAHKESSGLLYQLRNKETELDQRHQHEMDLSRQALRQSESELEQANHLQETSDSKLNLFADEKSKFESMVADLQASRQEFFSQTEDKVLEAEYKLEDMRKERSELKSRLSRVEKELASAKESFSLYKNRVKERLDDRESVIAALQSERSQAYDCAQEMVLLRRDLFQSLESAQVCPDVVRRIQSQDQSSFDDGSSLCTKEVEFWKEVIPAVGSSMQELSHAKSQLEDAERESERLTEDLARLESAEGDCQKQVEDERLRNEKLFALLRQAESEMERSVAQIRDMSSALVLIQEREAEAKAQARCMEEEWYAQKTDLEGSLEKITAEKGQAQTRLLGMEETLTTIQGSLSETTKRL
jgi:chromosome segregation ATPase